MTQYREENTRQGFIVCSNEDGSESWIPKDESNSDYQAYLNSVEHSKEKPTK